MDIEAEVKEILGDFGAEVKARVSEGKLNELPQLTDDATEEICQLFEPKPSESRLLTDEEIEAICKACSYWGIPFKDAWLSTQTLVLDIRKAQDVKTASIKDQERQQKLKGIKEKIGEITSPIYLFGCTEVPANISYYEIDPQKLEVLWKEEGV